LTVAMETAYKVKRPHNIRFLLQNPLLISPTSSENQCDTSLAGN